MKACALICNERGFFSSVPLSKTRGHLLLAISERHCYLLTFSIYTVAISFLAGSVFIILHGGT